MKLLRSTILLSLKLIMAQVGVGQDYFPLQVGNVWYLSSIPKYIEGKELIDGVEYYKICSPSCSYYKKDSTGNVYVKSAEHEAALIYKFDADIGDVWYSGDFEVRLESKTDTVITQNKVFYNCVRITFRGINVIDADHSIWFAPDVGIVKTKSLDWGIESYLIKAKVNGTRIPNDPIPLEIIETVPYDGQGNVPIDGPISFKLNFAVRSSFVDSAYIKIMSADDGLIADAFKDNNKYSFYKVEFTPDKSLSYNDSIIVTISSEMEDYTGDRLTEDYKFSFVTEEEVEEPLIFLKDTVSTFNKLSWADFDFGDYDNDGDQDLIIFGTKDSVDVGLFHHIDVYEKYKDKFLKKTYDFIPLNPGLRRGYIRWVDYNNDNTQDLVYSGKDSLFKSCTLFYRNMDGNFEIEPNLRLNFGRAFMDWNDYDLDGFDDLAIWGYSHLVHTFYAAVYKNDGGNLLKLNINDLPYASWGLIKWIDFNNDSRADIMTVSRQLNSINFYENKNNSFYKSSLGVADQSWLPSSFGVDFSDLENDGDIDLAVGNYLLQRGSSAFTLDTLLASNSNHAFPKFEDLDHDNDMELFLIGDKKDAILRTRTYIQIYENMDGELTLAEEINLRKYFFIYSAKWIDLNGDEAIDLAMMTNEGFQIYYNLMNYTDVKEVFQKEKRQALLFNAYPNPFNATTNIEYYVPVHGRLVLNIFNIHGQLTKTLVNDAKTRGTYRVKWDGTDKRGIQVASGIYFYQIQTGDFVDTKKLILLR